MPLSIIRGRCAFDTKNERFLRGVVFVSAYEERDKNFFRKIEKCRFLLSFCARTNHGFTRILHGFQGFKPAWCSWQDLLVK
jgi:hypothetical protein